MRKEQMHADAIRKLVYGFASVRAIIHSPKLVDYLIFHVCLSYATLSVPCSLVIICWEKADLLALL